MSIVHNKQKNGVIAVYDQSSTWDAAAKKIRTKRKYIGHLDKDGNFVPSSGKRGRPRKAKDISRPIKANKDDSLRLKIEYLEAEKRRLIAVLKEVKGMAQEIDALVTPSLEEDADPE